jgi:ankyrin repeat protein
LTGTGRFLKTKKTSVNQICVEPAENAIIEEGAEVDAVDRTGQTPLIHAVICENKGVIFLCLPCSRLMCLVYMMHNIAFA